MTIDDMVEYFGNSHQLKKQTGMAHQNWNNWIKMGYIPIESQIKIESRTNGKLKASLSHVPKKK